MKNNELLSSCSASVELLDKADSENIKTVWDRFDSQSPQCNYGQLGICCKNCNMGPCRIDPFGNGPDKGVCGATADTIVARNLLTHIATGAAAHSDHGRDMINLLLHIVLGKTDSYHITDYKKLIQLAIEFGIDIENQDFNKIAKNIATFLYKDFGRQLDGGFSFLKRAPQKRYDLWKKLNVIPRGIDREIVESMHRTHIGVDNDPLSLLVQGIRTALADGWAGSMIATETSDIIFGTPKPYKTRANLGVLNETMVNIIVHGHELTLSEMIVLAASDENLIDYAISIGAKGINICGMCCTGNEILMRHGIPLAGNFLQQELAIITGAVEAMVVDVQCIFPSLANLSECYHTLFISTSPKAHFPGAIRMEFDEANAYETACKIVKSAIDNFKRRNQSKVLIPNKSMDAMAGFSVESIIDTLGGTLDPLLKLVKDGKICGIAGVVGCNNPKVKHDYGHITLVKELIKNDILVVTTGCNAVACAKEGLLTPEAATMAGPGLSSVCNLLGIPPVLHMGSCVDISRILTFTGAMAKALDCDISDLPVAGGAPEWMSQKAVSIATYLVASGIYTVLGSIPPVLGSAQVTELLCDKIESILGAKFAVEQDPIKAAGLMIQHILKKRSQLFGEFLIAETISTMQELENQVI